MRGAGKSALVVAAAVWSATSVSTATACEPAAPRVIEDAGRRRGFCTSPCSLGGFAQGSVRGGPRESEAENELWREVDRREKAKSPGARKADGNYDELDEHGLYRVGRVGAPLLALLNDEGRALARAGKWEEAKKKFEGAYAKVGTPGVLFNLAWAEQNLGQYRSALKHYRLYLSLPPTEKITSEARGNAQKFSAECASKLCTIEVRGATKVTVEGEGPADVEPGTHKVEMDGPKGPKSKPVTCKPGETVTVEYEEKADTVVVPVPSATTTTTSRPPDPPPPEVGEKGSWVMPGVLGGVGVVGIGVGIGLGLASQSKADDVTTLEQRAVCSDASGAECATLKDARSSRNGLATGSVVGYVAGGTLLGAAVVAALVIQPWETRRKVAGTPSVVPVVGQGFGGVSIAGRF